MIGHIRHDLFELADSPHGVEPEPSVEPTGTRGCPVLLVTDAGTGPFESVAGFTGRARAIRSASTVVDVWRGWLCWDDVGS